MVLKISKTDKWKKYYVYTLNITWGMRLVS